jgi:tetratricopeptide (TPR) repeat protein
LCPERSDALFTLAVSCDLLGDKALAVTYLKKALAMNFTAVQVGIDNRQARIKSYIRLLRILRELHRLDELRVWCIQALDEFGTRQEIHNAAGIAYIHLGMLREALRCFERSLKIIVACNIDAFTGLCAIYRKAGRQEHIPGLIARIREEFGDHARYWALRDMTGLGAPDDAFPEGISREEIEKEKEKIRRDFLFV